jgi:hypothetical protein
MRSLLACLTRNRLRAREEIIVRPRRTYVQVQMRDFAPIRIPIAPLDDPERRAKLVERLIAATADCVGDSGVRLVLPRHQYVTKRWSLPATKGEFLDEMVRHQLDVRLSTGVEGMYWDYQADSTTNEAVESQTIVAYAAPRETVDDWLEIFAQAGLTTSRVTVQTDEALITSRSDASIDELVIVDTGESVELICVRRGSPLASGCCEKAPAAAWNEGDLREEWTRLSTSLPDDFVPRRVVVQEHAGPELTTWLQNTFVLEELVLPETQAEINFPPPRSPRPLELLRERRLPEIAQERRRRRIRFTAAAILLLLVIGSAFDSHLRGLDDEISVLTQEVEANARLLLAGERTAKTEGQLAQMWQGRSDWSALLDAVSRPLNEEADVRLTSLHGERGHDGRGIDIRVAGAAANAAAVPRLMSGYAGTAIPFSVSPLGVRPIRNSGGDGVQFEIRLASPGTETPARGSRSHVQ